MIDCIVVSEEREVEFVSVSAQPYVPLPSIGEKGNWGRVLFALFTPVSAIFLIFLTYFVVLILW